MTDKKEGSALALPGSSSGLVRGLPEEGATVVVASAKAAEYLRGLVLQFRGPVFLRRCHIVAIATVSDTTRLSGLVCRVEVDPSFWRAVPANVADRVRERIRQIRSVRNEDFGGLDG